MSAPTDARRPAAADARRKALLLVILCSVQFIDAFDVSSMGPALPQIQQDLGMPSGSLQWVVTAYVIGYGGFLLLGGRLADLFDRKRLLLGALAVFTAASVVGGLSTNGDMLIAARFAKGIAAAFSAPAALAILLHTYDDENERNQALGSFIAISAIGFTAGLVLGGALAEASWRLVLFVPAAMAAVLFSAAGRVIPAAPDVARSVRPQVDLLGALAVTSGLLALVYGVSRASTDGWTDRTTVGSLTLAAALLAAFLQIERVRKVPLVPLGIFGRRGLARGNATIFLLQGSYVAWQFLGTLYLQNEEGWSPLEVGLIFAPGGLLVMLTAQRWAGQVVKRGVWPIASAGMALMLAGTLFTLVLGEVNSQLVFGGAGLVLGLGYAMCFPAANVSAVSGARADEQGLASGLFIAALQVGAGVVLATVVSVFSSTDAAGPDPYRAGLIAVAFVAVLGLLVCATGGARSAGTPAASDQV